MMRSYRRRSSALFVASPAIVTSFIVALLIAALLVSGMTGCVRVPAWQRGNHADRRMQWSRCQERAAARLHTFAVREGASGGTSAGGGACGCD